MFERESSVSFSSLHRHLCSTSRELLANCFWKDIPCLCGLKANWSVVSCGKGATTRKSTTRLLFCLKPIYASFFFQNKKITQITDNRNSILSFLRRCWQHFWRFSQITKQCNILNYFFLALHSATSSDFCKDDTVLFFSVCMVPVKSCRMALKFNVFRTAWQQNHSRFGDNYFVLVPQVFQINISVLYQQASCDSTRFPNFFTYISYATIVVEIFVKYLE